MEIMASSSYSLVYEKYFSIELLNEVTAGADIDLASFDEDTQKKMVMITIHYAVNGPSVSPRKVTHFPVVGETSVNDLLDLKVTNSTMAKLARKIHRFLPEPGTHECPQIS